MKRRYLTAALLTAITGGAVYWLVWLGTSDTQVDGTGELRLSCGAVSDSDYGRVSTLDLPDEWTVAGDEVVRKDDFEPRVGPSYELAALRDACAQAKTERLWDALLVALPTVLLLLATGRALRPVLSHLIEPGAERAPHPGEGQFDQDGNWRQYS